MEPKVCKQFSSNLKPIPDSEDVERSFNSLLKFRYQEGQPRKVGSQKWDVVASEVSNFCKSLQRKGFGRTDIEGFRQGTTTEFPAVQSNVHNR